MSKFTIVIPVYNEAKNLKILVPKIYKELKNNIFELIIVDDDSNDETYNVLKKFKKNNFHHIIRKGNKDLSQSCVLGFKNAKYDKIIVMDGDLQHKPNDIKKFLISYKNNKVDIIVGSRDLFKNKKHNLNFFRLFASRLLVIIINFLLGKKTSDPMSGFFMFNKKIFLRSQKNLIQKGYKILLDLLYNKNQEIKVIDININFDSRMKGKSKMSLKILVDLIFMIFKKFKEIKLF